MAEETPTEAPEEVKGTLLTAEQTSEWGLETRIIEPGQKVEEEVVEEVVEPETEPEEEVVEEVQAPLPEDPGEFTPKDYSFKVVTYDDEGKKGKTVTVKSIEQWDELIEGEPNLGNASALLKAQRAATKMETGSERDQADWQAKKNTFDSAKQAQSASAEATQTMLSEINYLVDKKQLPKVAAEYVNADWNDPEIAKQPGVKEQIALINYMRKENNSRIKAGLKPMTSILDAFNAYQLDNVEKKAQVNKTKAAEARKEAGAKVAGASPSPVSVAPKGIAVGRGGHLRDLGAENWSTS